MALADMFDYSVTPEFEERFNAASKPNNVTADLEDAMNSGDIEVGVNLEGGESWGCLLWVVIGFFLLLMIGTCS